MARPGELDAAFALFDDDDDDDDDAAAFALFDDDNSGDKCRPTVPKESEFKSGEIDSPMLAEVLLFLGDGVLQLLPLAVVSKHWNFTLCCMPSLWAVLHFDKLAAMRVTDDRVVAMLGRHKTAVQTVVLRNCIKITERTVQFLVKECGHLLHVDLTNCQHVTLRTGWLNYLQSPEGGSELRHLRVGGLRCNSERDGPAVLGTLGHFSQLLTLDMAIQVNNAALFSLSTRLPQLTKLNLSQCSKLGNDTIRSFACYCKDLHDIRLGSCTKITSLGFASHLRTTKPVHLWLGGVSRLTDRAVDSLAEMVPPLLSLSLVGCPLLTSGCLNCLTKPRPLGRKALTDGLTELNIGGTKIEELSMLTAASDDALKGLKVLALCSMDAVYIHYGHALCSVHHAL
jgi:hypothetical protein